MAHQLDWDKLDDIEPDPFADLRTFLEGFEEEDKKLTALAADCEEMVATLIKGRIELRDDLLLDHYTTLKRHSQLRTQVRLPCTHPVRRMTSALKGRAARARRLFPKLTRGLSLGPITLLRLPCSRTPSLTSLHRLGALRAKRHRCVFKGLRFGK